MVNKQQPITVG